MSLILPMCKSLCYRSPYAIPRSIRLQMVPLPGARGALRFVALIIAYFSLWKAA